MKGTRTGTTIAMGAVLLLLIAGCGGSKQGKGSETGGQPAGTASSTVTQGAERQGNDVLQDSARIGTTPPDTSKAPPKTPPPAPPASGIPPATGKVETTASGLKYIDIVVGTGGTPKAGQIVSVHYTGWLTNGTKFDSSLDRGKPFQFKLGAKQVIAGWDEGVATMRVGGKRRLIIPPGLAYGPRGYPPVIPPNSELVFDIQLLGVQ